MAGAASVPSRATTISSRPRRKKCTLGRNNDSPPLEQRPPAPNRPIVRHWPVRPRATARQPIVRGLPCRLVESLRVLEDLRGLKNVFVGDQVIEQRISPVFAGIEDLAGQFLDHSLDNVHVHRLGDGSQHSRKPGHAVAVRSHRLVAMFGPFPADVRFPHQLDFAGIHAEEARREASSRLVVVLSFFDGSASVADVPIRQLRRVSCQPMPGYGG